MCKPSRSRAAAGVPSRDLSSSQKNWNNPRFVFLRWDRCLLQRGHDIGRRGVQSYPRWRRCCLRRALRVHWQLEVGRGSPWRGFFLVTVWNVIDPCGGVVEPAREQHTTRTGQGGVGVRKKEWCECQCGDANSGTRRSSSTVSE